MFFNFVWNGELHSISVSKIVRVVFPKDASGAEIPTDACLVHIWLDSGKLIPADAFLSSQAVVLSPQKVAELRELVGMPFERARDEYGNAIYAAPIEEPAANPT
jgi:hypothetical protein